LATQSIYCSGLFDVRSYAYLHSKEAFMRKQIGLRIRNLRKARGMTQDAVAEKAGLNAKYYAQTERAGSNLTLDTIAHIAKALDVSVAEIFEVQEDHPDDDRKVVSDLVRRVVDKGSDERVRRLRVFLEQILP